MLRDTFKNKENNRTLKKDDYRYEVQKLLSSIMTIAGNLLTTIDKSNGEDVDLQDLIEKITDIGKMATEASFKESASRKACLEPRFKSIQDILKETVPDGFIFGQSLEEKIKKAKDSEKLVKITDVPHVEKNYSGYFRHTLGPKPPPYRQSYTDVNQFQRPKISFKKSKFKKGQPRAPFNAGPRDQRQFNKN